MELVQMTIQDVKEMDLTDLEEALPRLQEEAVRAEEALKVAQERIREDAGRRAPVPSFVEVRGDQLVVNLKTRDKNYILLSSKRIPLAHVVRAESEPEVPWEVWRGLRVPGVNVPGVRFYACYGRRDKTLVISLKDETYERLITEVDDPAKVAETINDAVGALAHS
jgi:hypothetical protein